MAGLVDTLISGLVKSAMGEILKKTTGRSTTTKRTKRKTRTAASPAKKTTSRASRTAPPASGGTTGRNARSGAAGKPAAKQVSKRRTVAVRSKAKRSR